MAPKKAAKKKAKKHGGGKDLRRAYEHMNRVGILHAQLESETKGQVDTLSRNAQQALAGGQYESSADLLRAAEHIAFGSIASERREQKLNDALAEVAADEY